MIGDEFCGSFNLSKGGQTILYMTLGRSPVMIAHSRHHILVLCSISYLA